MSRVREFLWRWPLAIVVFGGWWAVYHYGWLPWKDDFWTWANGGRTTFGGPLAIASVAVLVFALLVSLYFLYNPWRKHHAYEAMGRGCTAMIAIVEAVVLVILLLGIYFRITFLIKLISSLTLGLAVWLLLGAIYEGGKSAMKKIRSAS